MLEGPACSPDRVAELPRGPGRRGWLTADDEVLRERVHAASRLDDRAPARAARRCDKFLGRTVRYQARLIEAIDRLGLTRSRSASAVPRLVDRLRRLSGDRRAG